MPLPPATPFSGLVPAAGGKCPAPRPELLAPAGDWDCARAAVENGADAIYFGLDRFNARMRACNFTAADLPELMSWLHLRGVRGYVTFNTLVFDDELEEAAAYLRRIIAGGADAAIVQDVGVCRLIRRLSPDFPIHASTQMTVTSAAGVAFARDLGASLVVLARENSVAEIEAIRRGSADGFPLEVFVHGALCVAYSGQCLTSEALGGRSANRGECAQACRMPYDLVCDGQAVDIGDRRYLVSPQDLCGLDVLPDLVRAGVASLKIEGRLKSPEYVASITRVYRQALDSICGPGPARPALPLPPTASWDAASARYELEMAFSRGLHTGWFRGIDNQRLVHARFGTKRGAYLGEVLSADARSASILLRAEGTVRPGDGVVFDAGRPEDGEEGGRVYEVIAAGPGELRLAFSREGLDFARIRRGQRLWKTSDPALERHLRASYSGEAPRQTRPLTVDVHGVAGQPLVLEWSDEDGRAVRVQSAVPLRPAENQPLTQERLLAQLGRLGGTAFHLTGIRVHLDPGLILPLGELNLLRRQGVAELESLRRSPRRWALLPEGENALPPPPRCPEEAAASPTLIALVRSLPQMEAAWAAGTREIYLELENPRGYLGAVQRFRELQAGAPGPGQALWVAAPRIHKPGEEWILRLVAECGADGYLVRNYDDLAAFSGRRRRGDFSLNVANRLAAAHWMEQQGLERLTVSYDLNAAQVEALLRAACPDWFELTLHQHMPLFHMEHCVFCAFLSSGKDYRDCGRPCEKHAVDLRDRVGQAHPLRADAGCRNTLFNARAQTGAEFLPRFLAAGLRAVRVEFLREEPAEVARTLAAYRSLILGETTGAELWKELRLIRQLGVTRGQLEAQGHTAGNARQA